LQTERPNCGGCGALKKKYKEEKKKKKTFA